MREPTIRSSRETDSGPVAWVSKKGFSDASEFYSYISQITSFNFLNCVFRYMQHRVLTDRDRLRALILSKRDERILSGF